jgi:glycosyltransferase involved in cell wall biosynthesis
VTKTLRRIVLLIPDASTLGGVQIRTVKTLRHAAQRSVDYVCISLRWERPGQHVADEKSRILVFDRDPNATLAELARWSPDDTVIVFPNNTLRGIAPEFRAKLNEFPLVFVGSGQLSYHLQDSAALIDQDYCNNLNVSKIVLLSQADRMMYSQFGIHETIVGFNPVETRELNNYSSQANRNIGYVGRIDFRTKGADRLIDIARAVQDSGFGKLQIHTVSNRQNSPDFDKLMLKLHESDLQGCVDLHLDSVNLEAMFGSLSALVLPSRKEAFGNSILEAYSYGVPVISSVYAPGPATLVEHEQTGLLMEDFDYATMMRALEHLSPAKLMDMSQRAFAKHRRFSMKHYYEHLEAVGSTALHEFSGVNRTRVFPKLKAIEALCAKNESLLRLNQELRERYKTSAKIKKAVQRINLRRVGWAVFKRTKIGLRGLATPLYLAHALLKAKRTQPPVSVSTHSTGT